MSDQKLRLTPGMRRVLRKAASLRPGNSVWAGDVYPAACIQALVRRGLLGRPFEGLPVGGRITKLGAAVALLDVVNLLED